jgi:hypothetical protein
MTELRILITAELPDEFTDRMKAHGVIGDVLGDAIDAAKDKGVTMAITHEIGSPPAPSSRKPRSDAGQKRAAKTNGEALAYQRVP